MCNLHDPMRFCIIIVSMPLVLDVDQAILMQYTMRSEFVQLLLKAENVSLCIERIEKEECA
jgi:predicted ABC-type exoprotein transport system permease subunit